MSSEYTEFLQKGDGSPKKESKQAYLQINVVANDTHIQKKKNSVGTQFVDVSNQSSQVIEALNDIRVSPTMNKIMQ